MRGDAALQQAGEAGAVEDVVAEHQRRVVVADVVGADEEGLGEAVGGGLLGVGDVKAEFVAVAEQASEAGQVVGCADEQDLPDAGEHECRQRVVDHRLVVDRQQLLGHRAGDRVQPGSGAAGEDDALHRAAASCLVSCLMKSVRLCRHGGSTMPAVRALSRSSTLLSGRRAACGLSAK